MVIALLDWVELATDAGADGRVRRIITGVVVTLAATGYLSLATVQRRQRRRHTA